MANICKNPIYMVGPKTYGSSNSTCHNGQNCQYPSGCCNRHFTIYAVLAWKSDGFSPALGLR